MRTYNVILLYYNNRFNLNVYQYLISNRYNYASENQHNYY